MREIEFRAWYKPSKEMFKVGQITLEKGTWNYEPDNREYIGVCVPYQPSFILMQYTGLKDKNGKKIFEGDIVKINDEVIAKVIWDNDYLGYFLYANEENSIGTFDYWGSIEVIGNIYDNPELLKEEL